jgi:quercetin dioxygenase-like cupin family protein
MLTKGELFENPSTGARLEIIDTPREGGTLEVERVYKPHTGKAGPHLHLDFDQWFEVMDGAMTMKLTGQKRELGPGETVHVPRTVTHVDPWNGSDADLRVRARFDPVPEFVEGFTEALGHAMREDRLNKQGEFPQLELFVILREYRARSYAANLPIAFQMALIAPLAALGRLRGRGVQA